MITLGGIAREKEMTTMKAAEDNASVLFAKASYEDRPLEEYPALKEPWLHGFAASGIEP